MGIPSLSLTKFSLITGNKRCEALKMKELIKKIQFSYRYVTSNREEKKKLANWDSWTWFIVGLDPNIPRKDSQSLKGAFRKWSLLLPPLQLIEHQHLLSSHYAKNFTYMNSFDSQNNSMRVREVKELPKIIQLISSWARPESRFLKAAKAHTSKS